MTGIQFGSQHWFVCVYVYFLSALRTYMLHDAEFVQMKHLCSSFFYMMLHFFLILKQHFFVEGKNKNKTLRHTHFI